MLCLTVIWYNEVARISDTEKQCSGPHILQVKNVNCKHHANSLLREEPNFNWLHWIISHISPRCDLAKFNWTAVNISLKSTLWNVVQQIVLCKRYELEWLLPWVFSLWVFTEIHPYSVICELNNPFSLFLYDKVIILLIITEILSSHFFYIKSIYSTYQQLELCLAC